MNSSSTCFSEYLRTQLKHRNFEVIAVETRRNGLEGLTPRADLHCSEIAREQRLLSLTVKTGKFCCIPNANALPEPEDWAAAMGPWPSAAP